MIKEKERELFQRWRSEQGYPNFMADGLFDEETWNKQNIKILFVLKEANWPDGDLDLCAYLLSEPEHSGYWKTWNNIVRWTQAIRTGGDYPETITKADKTACLKTITALNIKKVGGGARAKDEEIRDYGKRDAHFVKAQIELYQPDIIICCGRGTGKNADILYNYVYGGQVSMWQDPIMNHNYFICTLDTGKEIPVVSFRHPQIIGGHIAYAKSYANMIEIAEGLRRRGHLKAEE